MKPLLSILITIALLVHPVIALEDDFVFIEGVPNMRQFPDMPTGCEVVATTILLQYYQVDVEKEDIADALPKGVLPYYDNGILYGGNPYEEFVGSPYGWDSFGVYYEPILEIVDDFLPGRALDLTGSSIEQVYQSIDQGNPVMVWATIPIRGQLLDVLYNYAWYTESGDYVQWYGNEHAMVLVGYSREEQVVYLNDPYSGKTVSIDSQAFEDKWDELGRQAIAIGNGYEYDLEENRLVNFMSFLEYNGIEVSSNSDVIYYRKMFKEKYLIRP